MNRRHSLHWLSDGLDRVWLLSGDWLASILRREDTVLLVQTDRWIVLVVFLVLEKFLGAYSFLHWPWEPCRRLLQRLYFLIKCALISTVELGWLINAPEWIIRYHRNAQLIVVTVMALGGVCSDCFYKFWLSADRHGRCLNQRLCRF